MSEQRKLFGEQVKIEESSVHDVLGNPIKEYYLSSEKLARPLVRVPFLDTFQQFKAELRLFKYNEDVAVIYIDGKPKDKGIKPYRFYGHLDVKQVIATARAFTLLYKTMTGYPEGYIIELIQKPILFKNNSNQFKKPDYTRRTLAAKSNEPVLIVTLDPDSEIKKCDCGFAAIMKTDNYCPSCNRKFVWESK